MEPELFKFKVRENNTINQDGKIKKGGEEILLSEGQALEFRNIVEPADETAAAVVKELGPPPEMANLRNHEKMQVLGNRRTLLTEELNRVNSQISKIEKEDPKAKLPEPEKRTSPPTPPAEENRTK